jgi:hypothetical protein
LRWYWVVRAVVFDYDVRKTVVLYFGEKSISGLHKTALCH